MVVHDSKTAGIYDVNQAFCQLYGYTHDEALKLSVAQLSSGWQRCLPGNGHAPNREDNKHRAPMLRNGIRAKRRRRFLGRGDIDQRHYPVAAARSGLGAGHHERKQAEMALKALNETWNTRS